ncbi:MAG: hypothetical protein ORN54_07370 [Cyclobacteriaceae bacterium]|nr:hypothetical protein [Cyclobacteriaceae bacterium]
MKSKMINGGWFSSIWRLTSLFGILLFYFIQSVNAQNPNLFKQVNSIYDEQSPAISPDGKVLYLTIANHPQNLGGKKILVIFGFH